MLLLCLLLSDIQNKTPTTNQNNNTSTSIITEIIKKSGKSETDIKSEIDEIRNHFDNLLENKTYELILAKKYDVKTNN